MMKTMTWQTLARGALLLAVLALAGVLATMYGGAVSAAPGQGPLPLQTVAPMPTLPAPNLHEMQALIEVEGTLAGTVRTVELWATTGSLTVPDGTAAGAVVPVWGFSDMAGAEALVPGPVIRANAGETLRVILHNTLAESVSLAFPGHDGLVPDTAGAATGETATYDVLLTTAGTFLYEAGLTEGGARQAAMGLYGVLVVEDAEPVLWEQERILVLSEIDPAFNADPANYDLAAFKPKYWLLNGMAYPDTGKISVAAGTNLLIRWMNAGAQDRSVGILGLAQEIVAADGFLLPFPRGAQAEGLAPGQTRDSLVSIPTMAVMNSLYPIYPGSLLQHNDNARQVADGGESVALGGSLAFLHVTTGETFEEDGPVVSDMAFDKSRIGPGESATLTAKITVVGGTSVVAAEYFWDTPGDAASGAVLPITAGAVADVNVSTTALTAPDGGPHILYIRGMDDTRMWGPLGSAVLTVDVEGPRVTGMVLRPNPTNDSSPVALSATANESETGGGTVKGGQFSVDGSTWVDMDIAPADAKIAVLQGTIPTGLGEDVHEIQVRALDDKNNWSDPVAIPLTVDMTGPVVGDTTLVPATLDLSQPLPTYVRLTVDLSDAMSTLVNAYGFLDLDPTDTEFPDLTNPAMGFPLFPSDGLFDEASETAYYNMPAAQFAAMGTGPHTVWVIGKDKAGNLTLPEDAGAATLTVSGGAPGQDTVGPVISNLSASPNPTLGQNRLTLTATATDAASSIAAAEWFRGADPGAGNGNPMSAVDRNFNSFVEAVTASFNINQWPLGQHTLSVRAQDANGNWGLVQTVIVSKTDRFGNTIVVDGIVSENFLPLIER